MEYYLRRPETVDLVRKTVLGDLLSVFDECSLDLANAAIKVVFEDCLDHICQTTESWSLSKENYVEAVQQLYKSVLTKAKTHVFGQDTFVFQERQLQQKEESIY